jgi:hypothetical protein
MSSAVPLRSHPSLPEQRATRNEQRAAKEPEVLVPADQRIAIQRALALSASGTLDERMFPVQPLPEVTGEDRPPVPPIVVEDVVVPPIIAPGGGVEKGLGQIQ